MSVHSGIGHSIFFQTRFCHLSLSGTLSDCSNTMVDQSLLYVLFMNLGQQTDFGIRKYVVQPMFISDQLWIDVHRSPHFPRKQSLSDSSYMQIKQNYRRSAVKKATQLWHGARSYQLKSGMEMESEVAALLAGYPLCVDVLFLAEHTITTWTQVPEDAGETGKLNFVNFKRVVWHEAFYELLKSICQYSKTGYWHGCADFIKRLLFPFIFILSADYEEQ